MMFNDLAQKSILVTGASRGIGRAIALTLAAQKAHVVFNYRGDEAQAKELAGAIEAAGGKATALKFDMTDYEAMKTALDGYYTAGHTLQGLVNNAGKSKDQLVLRVKPEDIDDLMNVNLKATMVLTNYLAKHLMKAGGASIVNMSSIVGLMGNTAQTVYAATKAGLIGYTKSMAKELSSRQVRCNAVCPGFIATDMTAALTDKAKEEYAKNIPLGRMGEAQDIANLVCFLLSNASGYITGEVIKIDGGLYI